MLDITAARREYDAVGKVWCPYLGAHVAFERAGFDHLLYKKEGVARSLDEQWSRIRCIQRAVEIVRRTTTLQEFTVKNVFVRRRSSGSWSRTLCAVDFCGFTAIIDDRRYTVILKKSLAGEWKFHSVFPIRGLKGSREQE